MNNEGSFNDEELRKRAASNEELNIRLTNNYAFQKIFKNEEIVKGFLMALLHLKETDIETLEVADPFVEGEVKEEKLKCKIHIRKIGQSEVYFIIAECLQKG